MDDDADPYPDACEEAHGTNVAGLIAARIDNGIDIAGISNSCLISGRALDESGAGSTSDIADAIEWAADRGADVINLSLGGGGYTDTMKNAVQYAYNNGALPIAAAGGSGSDGVSYPAAYSECVAVSAVDSSENLASFSNYGSEVELCAPGVDVLTLGRTCDGSDYERLSGTSFTTAAVSGCAGLALAQWNLTNDELRSHLTCTAKDVGLPPDEQGSGQVNAYNAVTTEPGNCDGGGDDSVTETVSDSLSGYWDYDDWEWHWEFDGPSEVELALDGPSDADFDLYVNTGTTTNASPSNYDYASTSTDSQEYVRIESPDDSTPMQVDVDSYSGSGDYTLTITEHQ